jgi:hypothetical protein
MSRQELGKTPSIRNDEEPFLRSLPRHERRPRRARAAVPVVVGGGAVAIRARPWERGRSMDLSGWDLVVAAVIAGLILISVLALWLAGRSRERS